MFKRYFFYLIRWQLSTPILAIVLIVLADIDTILATIIANLIGGLIFFWVDRFIFRRVIKKPLWEINDCVECADCGQIGKGYRIVEWFRYDKSRDKNPKFRCENCKNIKQEKISEQIKHKS